VPWRQPPIAVGAACLLIGFGAAPGIQQIASWPGRTVVASIALRPLPQFPQWKAATGTAVMETDASGRLLSVTLRAPARPGFYEVWLLAKDGVRMISLGDLNSGHTGLFAMPPGVNLAEYSRIDVSLQPFNGSTLHSRDSVVRGSLP
jgi:anti-sigma-K factor RskA